MKATALVENLSGVAFEGRNFDGMNLRKRKMTHSRFINCSFDRCDMTEADCEWCDFTGSTFRQSVCYRTNFKDAKLAGTVFEPVDCYGMTLTLQCDTFRGLTISQQHWFSWLMFAMMMKPAENGPVKIDLWERLITTIGAERYVRLKDLFARRNL